MQFPTVVALSLALIQSSYAAPAVTFGGAMSKRFVHQLPPSDELVSCPDYHYSRPQIEAAAQQGITLTPMTEPHPGGYPHKFGNNRKLKFPNCRGKTLYEFPILPGGNVYSGGDPGANRVVFTINTQNPDTNPTENGAYCGLMTHDGAPENEFVLCK